MRNAWKVYLDLINLEEEIDRLVLRRNREELISEKLYLLVASIVICA